MDRRAATVVVMAKQARVGRAKTRLIGRLSPEQARAVHQALVACTLERLKRHLEGTGDCNWVVAIDADGCTSAEAQKLLGVEPKLLAGWKIVDQGRGDLGQRIVNVWRQIGGGKAAFFGVDCPDVPRAALRSAVTAIEDKDVAIGPVADGGYWTLSACSFRAQLLEQIDWGSGRVCRQTIKAAERSGLAVQLLAPWYDVDTLADLAALDRRLDSTMDAEAALGRLKAVLCSIFQELDP